MLKVPTRKVPRPVVRLYVALVVAVVAGTAVILGMSAALDATWDPRASVFLAISAVWIPQALIAASRHRRH